MRYFWATIKHKWFVFLASLKTGLPLWLALTHDLSKFSRAELPHYDRQFFGDKGDPVGFSIAWLHHQNHNRHHWEYWITRDNSVEYVNPFGPCLPMPDIEILHMITDWVAIRRAQFGTWDSSKWKRPVGLFGAKVHPQTRGKVLDALKRLGLQDEGALFTLHCFGLEDAGDENA